MILGYGVRRSAEAVVAVKVAGARVVAGGDATIVASISPPYTARGLGARAEGAPA